MQIAFNTIELKDIAALSGITVVVLRHCQVISGNEIGYLFVGQLSAASDRQKGIAPTANVCANDRGFIGIEIGKDKYVLMADLIN